MLDRLRKLVFLLTILTCQPTIAAVNAEIDRNQLSEGEALTLTLALTGDIDGDPDLSPLQSDFDILDRSQSSHTSIVNGSMTSKRIWRLLLAPKRVGKLTVPSIPVGSANTRAFPIEVLPAGSQAEGAKAAPVFVETEISSESPYVQGQVIYSIRIFARVNLRQASLTEPNVENALMERLGEDRSYDSFRNGQRYRVIERRYALFPQRSGPLTIDSPLLSATIPGEGRPNRRSDRFFGGFPDIGGMFEDTRPIRLRGKRIEMDVRPRPAESVGHWLPAESLELEENWSPEPQEVSAGTPLTRTITIRAKGVAASQLPDLPIPNIPGLKLYPDKPQSENRHGSDFITAVKTIKTALVPTIAGRVELPEIRLNWWDTNTDRQQTAKIPARSFEVTAATAPTQPVAPQVTPATPSLSPASPQPTLPIETDLTPGYWPWISIGLGVGWLITLFLWLLDRHRKQKPAENSPTPSSKRRTSVKDVKNAFYTNDPKTARQALLKWAAGHWPEQPPKGLTELASRLNEQSTTDNLKTLDRILYAPETTRWDGKAVYKNISSTLKKIKATAPAELTSSLPALYPSSPAYDE